MPSFVLHIFPDSGLASSLITTVWIGVFVVCFFNLRFGWNLSGLIVPGYLVPLLILKPWSAVAIIVEALFTYLLIWLFSEFSSRLGHWSNLFGRDRFFAIILFAVVSRILFDCFVFPEITTILSSYFNIAFVYKGGLYSIGLVIVALIANQFWNPGIKRGFPQLMVTLFVSYLIIRFLLIRYTNFRMSEVAYLYEDIATSILASPKVYIILIVTAFLASRMNLLYGWEFGGIVLPALLALQWYYPWKILSSIVEAGIIYGLAVLILKTPLFRNITIEGARKILLFFNIAFVYKMLVGFILPVIIPDTKILDVYGLGYMLTSLIAIKMYDKKIGLRMTRITLQTSLVAVFLATIIGFALLYIPIPGTSKDITKKSTIVELQNKYQHEGDITKAILSEQIKLYGIAKNPPAPDQTDIIQFKNALKAIKVYIKDGSSLPLHYATNQLRHLGYKLEIIDNKYIILYEGKRENSGGIYIISLNPQNNILVELPLSLQSPALIGSVLLLSKEQKFAALAIAGGRKTLSYQLRDSLTDNNSFYDVFRHVFYSKPTLQFYKIDDYIKNLLAEKEKDQLLPNKDYVFCTTKLSKEEFKKISTIFPKINEIKTPPSAIQHDDRVVAILLSSETIFKILTDNDFDLSISERTGAGDLNSFFTSKKGYLTAIMDIFKSNKGTKKSKPMTIEKASYIDSQVITPIMALTCNYSKLSKSERKNRLKQISFAANIVGCSISIKNLKALDVSFIVLSMSENSDNEYLGGTYLFRIGNFSPYMVEITNPADKNNMILGLYLGFHLKASAILVSGTSKSWAHFSYSDDTITARSLFNLINQVVIRKGNSIAKSMAKKEGVNKFTVVQVKSLPKSNDAINHIPNTIFLSTYHGKYKRSMLDKPEENIYAFLNNCKLNVQFVNGSSSTAGLEVFNSIQSKYLPETKNTNFLVLWLTANEKINHNFIKHFEKKQHLSASNQHLSAVAQRAQEDPTSNIE